MTDSGSSHRGDSRAGDRRSRRTLGALLALWALSLASPASAQGTFTRQLTITVGAGVVGGPHANFPLLVDVTNAAELATTGNGGRVQSPNGYDIVFRGEGDSPGICAPAAEPCMLDHDIELYEGAAGRVVAWVRVPSLANGRVIHMYYGNSQITSSTEASGAVFDADYVGVWHLKESGTGSRNEYRDSSRYANHGQGGQGAANATPARVSGKIGFGQHFGNATDHVLRLHRRRRGRHAEHHRRPDHPGGLAAPRHRSQLPTGTASVPWRDRRDLHRCHPPGLDRNRDTLVFTGAPSEFLTVYSRDSATQLTLMSWSPAGSDHTDQTYEIWPAASTGSSTTRGTTTAIGSS